MGFYINPPEGEGTKERWLARHGILISREEALAYKAEGADHRVVCLVFNEDSPFSDRPFTAAGIAINDQERDYMAAPDRGPQRERAWYLVSLEDLKPYWNPK